MKCWECKNPITRARVVHYFSPSQEKEASRDVCFDCLPLLTFDPCHYVRVKKLTQGSLRRKENQDNAKKPLLQTEAVEENTHLDCTIDMSKVESLIWTPEQILRNEA